MVHYGVCLPQLLTTVLSIGQLALLMILLSFKEILKVVSSFQTF